MTRCITSAGGRSVGRPSAFTLVELLVVIGVIAVLLGILLPVISGSRRQAAMTEELSGARQLMVGYLLYTQENRGALIPGRIIIKKYPGMRVPDDGGRELKPDEVANRWPWRLMTVIPHGLRGTILLNERATALADRDQDNWSYLVSVFPSFGMNMVDIGGDLEDPASNHANYLTKITQSRFSSQLIVFASARADASVHGYFYVRPPNYRMQSWPSATKWPNRAYDESDDAYLWGYVHPRWKGKAVVGCLDGHAEALTVDELRDMTRWSESAARAGDPDYMP